MRSCASRHMSVFDTSLMYVCPRVVYMPETGHEGAQECARGRVRVQSPPTHIFTRQNRPPVYLHPEKRGANPVAGVHPALRSPLSMSSVNVT